MRFLREDDVKRLLDVEAVVAGIEEAFRSHFETAVAPLRSQQQIGDGTLLLMPCHDPLYHAAGIKMATVAAGGSDRVQATYVLLDQQTLRPEVWMEANYLTEIRTAASSAVATKYLARKDSRVLGIFGTGREARAHALVFAKIFRLVEILVCGSTQEKAEVFAREVSSVTKLPAHAVDASACAREADIICTCTTSNKPLFPGELLRPGTHLNLVGTFQPDAQEVDEVAIQRARVIVDTYAGALAEAGDLLVPLRKGIIRPEHIVADLHEIVSGKKCGRTSTGEITIFKSVGYALEDLAAAVLVRDALKKQGTGD